MRNIIKKLVKVTLLILSVLMIFILFLIGTQSGLATLFKLSQFFMPGTFKLNGITGSLVQGFTIDKLEYVNNKLTVKMQEVKVSGSVHALLKPKFNLKADWQNLAWSNTHTAQGYLIISGALPNLSAQLSTQFFRKEELWQVIAALEGALPWKWDIEVNLRRTPPKRSQKLMGLYTTVSAKGTIQDARHGKLLISLKPGHYLSGESKLDFQGGEVQALLGEEALHGTGFIIIDKNKKLNLNCTLPQFVLDQEFSLKQPFLLNLFLKVDSLQFLEQLSPEIRHPKGQLQAILRATGSLSNPVFKSELTLKRGGIEVPRLGLNLYPIDLTLKGKEKEWDTQGSITSVDKKLIIKGKVGVADSLPYGKIKVTGKDVLLVNSKEYQIKVSPHLDLDISSTLLAIKGSIKVPYAQIKPIIFSNSIAIPEDVVVKASEAPKEHSFNTRMNLHFEMGKEVEVHAKGLNSHLEGIVDIKQEPKGPIKAAGSLIMHQGFYKAYGQNLIIEQGRLFFPGGRIDNPEISLRASKTIKTVTSEQPSSIHPINSSSFSGEMKVGVAVSGPLSQPNVRLFSNPSLLSQADILSMLILGRPANQLNKAGGQVLLTAITSMASSEGSNKKFIDQLKQKLGVDLDIKINSQYNVNTNQVNDSTRIVLNKSLSKNLHLTYNQGLSQTDPNIVALKYILNQFFSIQMSSSTNASGIDILYTAKSKAS